jgi:putative nucleotidyltransferase with HDIG domain
MKETDAMLYEQHTKTSHAVPGVAKKIVELVDNSRTRVAQLSAALMHEPLLTSMILRKANTIEYGLRNRIENLDLAIIVLGFDVLKKTIASALIHDALKKIVDVMFKFDELWNHSIGCGVIAHSIAQEEGTCNPNDAFVAGLLHDVGHVINRLDERDQPPRDHADVGAAVAESWGLPTYIVEAIRLHHTPEKALVNKELTRIVYVADVYCQTQSADRFSGEMDAQYAPPTDDHGRAGSSIGEPLEYSSIPSTYGYDLKRVINVQQMVKTVKDSIVQALSKLPKTQKIVVGLHYYENLSFDEIGKICEMEPTQVRELHDTAVATLKNMFVPID